MARSTASCLALNFGLLHHHKFAVFLFKLDQLLHLITEWYIPSSPRIPCQPTTNTFAETVLDTSSEAVGFRGVAATIWSVQQVVVHCSYVRVNSFAIHNFEHDVGYNIWIACQDIKVWVADHNIVGITFIQVNLKGLNRVCPNLI